MADYSETAVFLTLYCLYETLLGVSALPSVAH